jgi:hypothetical protein
MKTRILYLLFLILIAGVGTFLKIYVYDRQKAAPGNIQIVSVPESSVFINTQAVGRTPFNQPYSPGTYTVKLIPLSMEATASPSAVTWEGKVEVRSRQYTYIRRELANTEIESAGEVVTLRSADLPVAAGTGDIEIQTDPPGAVVSLDGEYVGVSPQSEERRHTLAVTEELFESIILTTGSGLFFKEAIERDRPDGSGNHSLPSAHTALAFSLAGTLAWNYPWYVGASSITAASFIGFARVDSGVHFLSDVVAGAGLGLFWATAVHFFHDNLPKPSAQAQNMILPWSSDGELGLIWRRQF